MRLATEVSSRTVWSSHQRTTSSSVACSSSSSPEDITGGVVFLVSDDVRMVHGITLDVDGGISATRLG